MAKNSKFKKILSSGFREMIPIILGILIALFVNNWNENRVNRNFVNEVLTSIESELIENKTEFEMVLPQHYKLTDTLNYYIADSTITLTDLFNKLSGFRLVSVKNTAWKSFINANMSSVDFKVISKLTDIEEDKKTMNIQIQKVMDVYYNINEVSNRRQKENFALLLNDIIIIEESLLKSHKECLEFFE